MEYRRWYHVFEVIWDMSTVPTIWITEYYIEYKLSERNHWINVDITNQMDSCEMTADRQTESSVYESTVHNHKYTQFL